MIGFFPEIYPDELIYSWFARYYQRSGYSAYIDAIKDIYERCIVRPDVEFINRLNNEAEKIITAAVPMTKLIEKHTMFPYYSRFLPVERRRRAYQAMLDMDANIHNKLAIPTNRKNNRGVRHVRYCPVCAAEDRQCYGETYIHRNHQMINVDICYRHRCFLRSTKIPISGKASPRLYVFDSIVEDLKPEQTDNETEIRLARYVTEVFQSKVELDNPIKTGDFLHAKMERTPYRSVRGQQRNISLLHKHYRQYYQELSQKGVTELWQLQKILNGYRWNTYEVCQLAAFLNISVNDLANMSLPEKSQEQIFDERVRELHAQGLKYPVIARELGASLNIVKPIGEGCYLTRGRKGREDNKGAIRKFDWERLDHEMVPYVEKSAKKLYNGDGGRPHRVNPFAVSKDIKLTEGRLKNMPMCMKLIQSYVETQEHYWAREVRWAVSDIKEKEEPLTWTSIRRRTNMKRCDLYRCLVDLKKQDRNVYNSISFMITKDC